jgi:hypothetical protein
MPRIKPKALLAQSKKKKGPAQFSITSIITYLLSAILIVSALYAGYKYFLQSTTTPQVNN